MLIGSIDEWDRRHLRGWACDTDLPDTPVSLAITANGLLVERVVANILRPDVQQAGHGRGRHGFSMVFNPPLASSRHWVVHLRSEADSQHLPGSPLRIEASTAFDAPTRSAYAAALAAFETPAQLFARVAFLTEQRHRLIQMRRPAGMRSGRPTIGNTASARRRASSTTRSRQRALVIDDEMPDGGRDAGSKAVLSHMRSLQRLGFEVSFTCASLAGGAAAAELERSGITCCVDPWCSSVEEALRGEADAFDVVYLHRVSVAAAYLVLVRRHQPKARVIYSVADLHHVRCARQAEAEGRPELMEEARRLRTQELFAAQMADAVITHSSQEAALLRRYLPQGRVHTMLWSIPVGRPSRSFAERSGVAFIGSYSHAPNLHAARLLREEIMPRVRRADPTIVCRLVGSDMPRSLRTDCDGVTAVGRVNKIETVLDSVRLTVAPLAFGAGVKGKVIESLAAGVPCVCSPVAAEGLDLPLRLRRLVSADLDSFVKAVVRVHSDEAYHAKLSGAGRSYAQKNLSEEHLDRCMLKAVAS